MLVIFHQKPHPLEKVKSDISEEDFQKCLYIIEENNRVQQFSKAIEEDNIGALGTLLYQSHHGLSKQYKVSCDELDFLVEKTIENKNILGARMMGGGFGGCTINLIARKEAKVFTEIVSKAYQNKFNKDCSVYFVELSEGTHLIK